MPRRADRPRFSPTLQFLLSFLAALLLLFGCSRARKLDPSSITFLLESNPANLDPRFATDAQSQHLDGLIFSGLVEHDAS
jgi:peptide/nickel transport system substrate-binding protein